MTGIELRKGGMRGKEKRENQRQKRVEESGTNYIIFYRNIILHFHCIQEEEQSQYKKQFLF